MKKLFTVLTIALFGLSTTFAQTTQTSTAKASTKTSVHTKADGTPDKRYKENKVSTSASVTGPTKKDGTLDMRYKANKSKTTKSVKKTTPKM